MKSTLLDAASKVVPNQQILVNIVSQRVRQLAFGARPLISALPGVGAADIALMEIAGGKLTYEAVPHEDWVKPELIKFPPQTLVRQKSAA